MEERILNHLIENGSITIWEAIRDYGCTRLSEYIRRLRRKNFPITDEWIKGKNRYGEKISFKKYILEVKE